MGAPFDRMPYKEGWAIKRYLGDFVSHKVVHVFNGHSYDCPTIAELNKMDRKKLADTFYNEDVWRKRRWDEFISVYYCGDFDAFLEDVAQYIDDRIPRAYQKYQTKGENPGSIPVPRGKDGNPDSGLVYHYEDNKKPSSFVVSATQKQINYLTDLASKQGYSIAPAGMSKDDASKLIGYFLDNGSKEQPSCFSQYFTARPEGESEEKPKKKGGLTEEMMIKIDWFADQEARRLSSKLLKFAAAIERTDFSKTDPNSIHEARDLIVEHAVRYGITWDKADTCYDCYHIEGGFKVGNRALNYSVGFSFDYFDLPREEIWQKMPEMVIEKFGAMTPEKTAEAIKESMIEYAKHKRFK